MKVKFWGRMMWILVAAFAIICMIGFTTQADISVYADTGSAESAINKGSDVLKKNVNTENAQIAWYGGEKWYLVSYDDHGNKYTAKDGTMTLFMKSALDDIPYNTRGDNTFLWSKLHQYLSDWCDKFCGQEQDAMAPRLLKGGCSNKPKTNDLFQYDPDKIKGALVITDVWPLTVAMANDLPQKIRCLDEDPSPWWLCSPGVQDDYAAYVDNTGGVNDEGMSVENKSHTSPCYARPAIDLDKSKVLMTSAAVGGKKSGSLDLDALTPVDANETNEWKLTVKDSNRDSFRITDVQWFTFPTKEPHILYIVYTGAVSGDNNYISGVIVNAEGKVTYYGRLDAGSEANDFLVDLKGKFNEGDTLYIFNEQVNGDNQTDWSSDFIKIDIPEKLDYDYTEPEDVIWIDFGKKNQKDHFTESLDEDVVFGYKEDKGRMLYFSMGSNKAAKKALIDQDGTVYVTRDSNIGTLQKRVWAPAGSTFYMHIAPGVKKACCWAYVDIYGDTETLTLEGKTVRIKAKGKKLKKNVIIQAKKAYDIPAIAGKPAFAKVKADRSNSKFAVNAKTGKITVRKGLKRGTYYLIVNVHIPGSGDNDPYDETATVTIKVK